MPVAQPRRSGGNAAFIRASASGMTKAAPAPWNVRAAMSTSTDGASAHAAEATVNSPSPAAKTRRRPYRSPRAAPVISSTAKQNVRVAGPFEVLERGAEVALDRAQGGGDHEHVEHHHERGQGAQSQDPALRCRAVRHARGDTTAPRNWAATSFRLRRCRNRGGGCDGDRPTGVPGDGRRRRGL